MTTKPVQHTCGPYCAPPCPAYQIPARWTQFESDVLTKLREARAALASAGGGAQADNMVNWAAQAFALAAKVKELTDAIERNAQIVMRESCR